MNTLHLIVICATLLLITAGIIVAYIYKHYCLKRDEFTHKIELENLRNKKIQDSELQDYKIKVKREIINEITMNSPEIIKVIRESTINIVEKEITKITEAKFEVTLTDKVKMMEEQIKILTTKLLKTK